MGPRAMDWGRREPAGVIMPRPCLLGWKRVCQKFDRLYIHFVAIVVNSAILKCAPSASVPTVWGWSYCGCGLFSALFWNEQVMAEKFLTWFKLNN